MQIDQVILRECWFLAGPTACGKTAAGLALAQRLDAEIVSLDSMAVYRGMDIGTAKPTPEERRRVPHHLIDLVEPHEEYSVASYLRDADAACRNILNRGRTPLFVGGTGLYLRAVLRGVFEAAPRDRDFRRRLNAEAEMMTPDELHARLRAIDPVTAKRLHPNDRRRIIRALEVHYVTGRPASELQRQRPLPVERRPRHVYWLHPPRDWLHRRIDLRVDRMMAAGLVDEVRNVLSSALRAANKTSHIGRDFRPTSRSRNILSGALSRTARQALGYREVLAYLADRCSLDEAVTEIKQHTRQFAKRQHTWFRNLEECIPVPITGEESPEEIAHAVLSVGCEST